MAGHFPHQRERGESRAVTFLTLKSIKATTSFLNLVSLRDLGARPPRRSLGVGGLGAIDLRRAGPILKHTNAGEPRG